MKIFAVHYDVGLSRVTVNGADVTNVQHLTVCGDNSAEIRVTPSAPTARVSINGVAQNPRRVNLPRYGDNTITITVTVENVVSADYTRTIYRSVPASVAFYNRFDDVLTVPVHIEGIGTVHSVEWYHNGNRLNRSADKGYLEMKEAGVYYALLNGSIRTCEVTKLQATYSPTMSVYPNPAVAGQKITVSIVGSDEELQNARLQMISIDGRLLQTLPVTGKTIQVTAPPVSGVVVLKLISETGDKEAKVVIK